jgi:ketosteroid isomerase-like protein
MKKIVFIVCGILAAATTGWAAPADAKEEKAVMATLEAMAKATINKDVATLSKIYSDDLTYSHSSAMTQTKAEVLKAFESPSVAESMKFVGTTVRIYGPVALAKGLTEFRNGRPGAMVDNHLNILWVLVKGPGPYGYQIVARQTTRLPEAAAAPAPRTTTSR